MITMENLLNLNYEGQGIRSFNVDGELYVFGKDVAKVLGYKDLNRAVSQLVDKEDKKSLRRKDSGVLYEILWDNNQDFTNKVIINEAGIYSLIFNSDLKSAKKFKRWVMKEVLPSIRKTGSYSVNNNVTYNLNVDTEEWRKELVSMIRGIATTRCKKERIMYGKSISYCWSELSKGLNSNLGINIESRITRTRKRMIKNGISKTESNKFGLTRLVSQDKSLLEESSRIVFEMAGKYSYNLEETDNTNFKIILNKQLSNLELEKQKLINSKKLLN